MPTLLQNDFFVIGLISIAALLVRRQELASAVIYAVFCWLSLFASYQVTLPEFVLSFATDPDIAIQGWYMLLSSFFSMLAIAIIYAVRMCVDGKLPRLIIYFCYGEILLHITCYCLLLNGMSWMTYNWIVLAVQIAVILLFIARGSYGRTILRARLFRDFANSH
jgi:hypothetical protein